ncbi:MAG: nuclear transport factor 2 family protein [Acidobacteria bacterium]|nr:nuclear transport factor 2 family protein [Acidobacteriota bacterium]
MDVLRKSSGFGPNPRRPNTGRRSFIWRLGAAISAAAASVTPGFSNSKTGRDSEPIRLAEQLAILQAEREIRKLHRTYETRLDSGMYEEVVDLFTEDGEVLFHGGLFAGITGIARLYREGFSSGFTGRKLGPAPGVRFEDEQQEIIEVAGNCLSARTRFPYSIQVGIPMAPDSQLVQMARLHGEGVVKWCEAGFYEVRYRKEVKSGEWKIVRLEHHVLSSTDYRLGRSHAKPVSVPLFAKTYPEDPIGPDTLINPARTPQEG